ncbi:type II toxin-antitoxin system VapC family toxin [Rhodoplanes roseus]|uniref:type II toxin-antitoxin system VapC family toxin n=1 Tax=Rhodoplanes roseus TaxID=29409 RepID=UPI001472F765|nr:type II toxin-antitoxin system VapC family toxin [Rhodoplanes roseus]
MTLVVDASVAVRWAFKTSDTPAARSVLGVDERLIAPDLIIAEIASAAWKLVQFERFDADLARRGLDEAVRLVNEIVPCATLKDRAFAIALDLRHPVYDCFYLALCEVRGCRLASLDARLARKCAATPYAALLAPVT